MEFLPEELLVNILVRLPLKDLLRFKIVSKSWLKVISSPGPYFTTNYVRNSPFPIILRAQGNYRDPSKLYFSLIEFAGNGGEYTLFPIITPKLPDQGPDFYTTIISSCYWSVFILNHKRSTNHEMVYMFNPISGSCVLVADHHRIPEELRHYNVGFIPSNNTYKLVRFYHGTKKIVEAEILTVGLDKSWRKLDDDPLLFKCALYHYERAICFSGAYHWLSCWKDDMMIYTFDLLEEKSGTIIPIPPGVTPRLSLKTRMTILNDRLSVADLSHDSVMVIWTMKEYGLVESWSKFVVLTLCNKNPERSRYYGLLPIAVLANGDILFAEKYSSKGMYFYNLEEKRLTQKEKSDSSFLYRSYENTYIPRFYTPHS